MDRSQRFCCHMACKSGRIGKKPGVHLGVKPIIALQTQMLTHEILLSVLREAGALGSMGCQQLSLWKFLPDICEASVDHPGSPTLGHLAFQDQSPKLPMRNPSILHTRLSSRKYSSRVMLTVRILFFPSLQRTSQTPRFLSAAGYGFPWR